jgi:hypothetical protein
MLPNWTRETFGFPNHGRMQLQVTVRELSASLVGSDSSAHFFKIEETSDLEDNLDSVDPSSCFLRLRLSNSFNDLK